MKSETATPSDQKSDKTIGFAQTHASANGPKRRMIGVHRNVFAVYTTIIPENMLCD